LVLLERAEEDANHGVALDISVTSAFKVDIGFVQEQHSVPGLADLQDLLQLVLKFPHVGAKLTCVDGLQGFVQLLRSGLRSQRLPHPRGAVQEEDDAPTLPVDDVIVDLPLVLDDRVDVVLALGVHHQLVEAVRLESNRTHAIRLEFPPLFGREAEALEPRLAVTLVLFFPSVDGPAVLPLGLVRVDLPEGVLVDHDSPGGPLFEGHLAFPGVLDQVALLLHLADGGCELVEVLPPFGESLHVFGSGTRDREVLDELEVLVDGDGEVDSEPDEVLAVLLDAVGVERERVPLAGSGLLGVLHAGHDGATLIRTHDLVPHEELLLQVFETQYRSCTDFFGLLELVLKLVLQQFVELVQVGCLLRFISLLGVFLQPAPVLHQAKERPLGGLVVALRLEGLPRQPAEVVLEFFALFTVQDDVVAFECLFVRIVFQFDHFNGSIRVFLLLLFCGELDLNWVEFTQELICF